MLIVPPQAWVGSTAGHMGKGKDMKISAIALATLALSSAASADILTATWTSQHSQGTSVEVAGDARNIKTVTFNWTRIDSPGPNIDDTIAQHFTTYCIEINDTVGSFGSPHEYDVLTPAEAGFSALQELLFGRLWASFQPLVNDKTTSAAFQLAIWEIAIDGDGNIASGDFQAFSPSTAVALADTWLSEITDANYAGGYVPMRVLFSETKQDQITAVPSPGSLVLLALGGMLAVGRRRR